MDKTTKLVLIGLGTVAAITAVVALAMYEEDQNQTLSKAWDDVSNKAQKQGKRLAKQVDQLDLPEWVERFA